MTIIIGVKSGTHKKKQMWVRLPKMFGEKTIVLRMCVCGCVCFCVKMLLCFVPLGCWAKLLIEVISTQTRTEGRTARVHAAGYRLQITGNE